MAKIGHKILLYESIGNRLILAQRGLEVKNLKEMLTAFRMPEGRQHSTCFGNCCQDMTPRLRRAKKKIGFIAVGFADRNKPKPDFKNALMLLHGFHRV
jgi:hypothetical protein